MSTEETENLGESQFQLIEHADFASEFTNLRIQFFRGKRILGLLNKST